VMGNDDFDRFHIAIIAGMTTDVPPPTTSLVSSSCAGRTASNTGTLFPARIGHFLAEAAVSVERVSEAAHEASSLWAAAVGVPAAAV
jgi:hypothetical protein